MKQEITEDEYMKKGLAKEVKRVFKEVENPYLDVHNGDGHDYRIFKEARETFKKAILKLVI